MNPKLPVVKAKELVRALKRAGFKKNRQKGAHLTLVNERTNKTITIPIHTGVDIGKGLLKKILHDANLTIEELLKFL